MSLDPNWFYSSLCQCAAVLVGLIGAILTARIQSQITSSTETRNAVQKSLTNLRTSIAGTLGQLNSYDAWVRVNVNHLNHKDYKDKIFIKIQNKAVKNSKYINEQFKQPIKKHMNALLDAHIEKRD